MLVYVICMYLLYFSCPIEAYIGETEVDKQYALELKLQCQPIIEGSKFNQLDNLLKGKSNYDLVRGNLIFDLLNIASKRGSNRAVDKIINYLDSKDPLNGPYWAMAVPYLIDAINKNDADKTAVFLQLHHRLLPDNDAYEAVSSQRGLKKKDKKVLLESVKEIHPSNIECLKREDIIEPDAPSEEQIEATNASVEAEQSAEITKKEKEEQGSELEDEEVSSVEQPQIIQPISNIDIDIIHPPAEKNTFDKVFPWALLGCGIAITLRTMYLIHTLRKIERTLHASFWARWQPNQSLEQLKALPQEQLLSMIKEAMYGRYNNVRRFNDFDKIMHAFLRELKTEKSNYSYYVGRAKSLLSIPIFNIRESDIQATDKALKRIEYIEDLVKTWLSTYKAKMVKPLYTAPPIII